MCFVFFFNDTATTEIYTLPLHDPLPICSRLDLGTTLVVGALAAGWVVVRLVLRLLEVLPNERVPVPVWIGDRKSTRLNSSHANISYAVFCLKKKKTYTHLRDLCDLDPHL